MLEFSEQCKEHHFVDESFRAEAIWALPTALLNLRYRIDCSDTFSWSNFQNFQLVCRCVFFSQGPMFFWLFHWVSLWIFPAFIHFSSRWSGVRNLSTWKQVCHSVSSITKTQTWELSFFWTVIISTIENIMVDRHPHEALPKFSF